MRGNELGKRHAIQCVVVEFSIPMRGNEILIVALVVAFIIIVFDPHEG